MSTTSLLHGKTAIVTGGSGTIGKAIANALLVNGCSNVVLTGRNLERLKQAQSDLGGASCVVIPCDVSNESSALDLFLKVEQDYGGCDLLVNNAGISGNGVPTVELDSSDDFSKVLNVNVVGPFTCARLAMKSMVKKSSGGGGGRIINVGSIASYSPRPDAAAYTTSKFALRGLTESLSLDGRKHNIAVGMVHPGNVISGILSEEEVERRSATEGFIKPEDVANCVLTMATLPYTANVLELTVIPTRQPLVGRG
mmetsp:Transcript_22571/g.34502  ORF Transcript_22571/g.34502 Transcript_22571/m.34502 type:complete len:254 (-) Transcript_22571:1333-2094(-)